MLMEIAGFNFVVECFDHLYLLLVFHLDILLILPSQSVFQHVSVA